MATRGKKGQCQVASGVATILGGSIPIRDSRRDKPHLPESLAHPSPSVRQRARAMRRKMIPVPFHTPTHPCVEPLQKAGIISPTTERGCGDKGCGVSAIRVRRAVSISGAARRIQRVPSACRFRLHTRRERVWQPFTEFLVGHAWRDVGVTQSVTDKFLHSRFVSTNSKNGWHTRRFRSILPIRCESCVRGIYPTPHCGRSGRIILAPREPFGTPPDPVCWRFGWTVGGMIAARCESGGGKSGLHRARWWVTPTPGNGGYSRVSPPTGGTVQQKENRQR